MTPTRWWVRDKFSLQDKGPTYANISFPDETIEVYKAADVEAVLAELEAYRAKGLTEEILRRHDGYVTVGKECEIAVSGTTVERDALRVENERLMQERAGIEQVISVEFAKKNYTDDDRQHKDLLENLGVFLDHHQELEREKAALEARVKLYERLYRVAKGWSKLQFDDLHGNEKAKFEIMAAVGSIDDGLSREPKEG